MVVYGTAGTVILVAVLYQRRLKRQEGAEEASRDPSPTYDSVYYHNTTSNLTYYNLTGLVNGTTYNITVMAVNSAGNNSDVMEYIHLAGNVITYNEDLSTVTCKPTHSSESINYNFKSLIL